MLTGKIVENLDKNVENEISHIDGRQYWKHGVVIHNTRFQEFDSLLDFTI